MSAGDPSCGVCDQVGEFDKRDQPAGDLLDDVRAVSLPVSGVFHGRSSFRIFERCVPAHAVHLRRAVARARALRDPVPRSRADLASGGEPGASDDDDVRQSASQSVCVLFANAACRGQKRACGKGPPRALSAAVPPAGTAGKNLTASNPRASAIISSEAVATPGMKGRSLSAAASSSSGVAPGPRAQSAPQVHGIGRDPAALAPCRCRPRRQAPRR